MDNLRVRVWTDQKELGTVELNETNMELVVRDKKFGESRMSSTKQEATPEEGLRSVVSSMRQHYGGRELIFRMVERLRGRVRAEPIPFSEPELV